MSAKHFGKKFNFVLFDGFTCFVRGCRKSSTDNSNSVFYFSKVLVAPFAFTRYPLYSTIRIQIRTISRQYLNPKLQIYREIIDNPMSFWPWYSDLTQQITAYKSYNRIVFDETRSAENDSDSFKTRVLFSQQNRRCPLPLTRIQYLPCNDCVPRYGRSFLNQIVYRPKVQ